MIHIFFVRRLHITRCGCLKTTKRKFKLFIALVLISIIIFYTLQRYVTKRNTSIKWTLTQEISCHYETEEDALQPAEDVTPPENSIFFHETTCRSGLNFREACAIESAARKHPTRFIYVFFNSPISEEVLMTSFLAKLTLYRNVKLARLHTAKYAEGTALGEMLLHNENNQGLWRIENTSDLLRYISMFKYGGLYLDTDVLVVKPLDPLGNNWVAKEDDSAVNVALLAMTKEGVGRKLVTQILDDLKSNYQPTVWSHNGPGAMQRALLKFCNATQVSDLNSEICHGFKVYNPWLVYPVKWEDAGTYFRRGFLPSDVDNEHVFSHHLWNYMTRDTPMERGSPYDTLTKQHCPSIREMYDDLLDT